MRTGDYQTPAGTVLNSFTDMNQASVSAGRYGEKYTFNAGYMYQEGTYGVPVPPGGGDEGPVSLQWTRQNLRFNGAAKNLGPALEDFQFALNYSDWNHKEITERGIGTEFLTSSSHSEAVSPNGNTAASPGRSASGEWTGDYKAQGLEALSPPTVQLAGAVFALEELSWERFRLQPGARAETNHYTPQSGSISPETGLPYLGKRFTGISFSTGWLRPALARRIVRGQLYSLLPCAGAGGAIQPRCSHPGNNVFEIGNPNLTRESADGIELSLRHKANRFRFETNLFYNSMHDFVYFEPTGIIEENLPQARYDQADCSFWERRRGWISRCTRRCGC